MRKNTEMRGRVFGESFEAVMDRALHGIQLLWGIRGDHYTGWMGVPWEGHAV